MILVILAFGILTIILGVILYDKLDSGKDEIGTIFQIVGTVATIISTIVAIVLLIYVLNRVNIEKKIALYEEENTKIEQQIADTVKQYQEYEPASLQMWLLKTLSHLLLFTPNLNQILSFSLR